MANPQKENGYLSIANEIVDHIVGLGLTGREYDVVLFVIRKTYGFNKKEDRIALSQFERATMSRRSVVCKTINNLVAYRILVRHEGVYSLNKNWEQWLVAKRRLPSRQAATVAKRTMPSRQADNQLVAARRHTKDTLTKDNIQKTDNTSAQSAGTQEAAQKKTKKAPIEERYPPEVVSEINTLIGKFYDTVNPNISYPNASNREEAAWLIKKYGVQKLLHLVDFAASIKEDPFAPTVYTPKQLREKMPALIDYYKRKQAKVSKESVTVI